MEEGEEEVEMARMADIAGKKDTPRKASARGKIKLKKETLRVILEGKVKKGDVLTIAKIAALQAIKKTWETIPLCHPIPLTSANVDFQVEEGGISCLCEVSANYKTGVEMEALYGATVALLTIWDMVKYLEKDERGQYPFTKIGDIVVLKKEK